MPTPEELAVREAECSGAADLAVLAKHAAKRREILAISGYAGEARSDEELAAGLLGKVDRLRMVFGLTVSLFRTYDCRLFTA